MYFFTLQPSKKLTSFQLRAKARQLQAVESIDDLVKLLSVKRDILDRVLARPVYTQFHLPKPNGEQRLIETAEPALRGIQKALATYFQGLYFPVRPACAYGSVLSPVDEPRVRNIYTNAEQHIGKKWLANMDIQHFFPSITGAMIVERLVSEPFLLRQEAAQLLTSLCTNENRLPQGVSTSPILANLVCLSMDRALEALAVRKGWTYTRFIDDMTFSGKKAFKPKHVEAIRNTIEAEGFVVNPEKIMVSRVQDEPVVTGLVLKAKKPDVSKDYIRELENDIAIYHGLTRSAPAIPNILHAKTLERYRLHLLGRIQFVRFVRGGNHKSYLRLRVLMHGPMRA